MYIFGRFTFYQYRFFLASEIHDTSISVKLENQNKVKLFINEYQNDKVISAQSDNIKVKQCYTINNPKIPDKTVKASLPPTFTLFKHLSLPTVKSLFALAAKKYKLLARCIYTAFRLL